MALNAFVLAAGFGTRLRPITDVVPKPLLPILGRPILEYVLDSVLDLPVDKVGVNLHHLGDQIQKWLETTPYCEFTTCFPENPILGTGGALFHARDFLKGRPFLTHNGDILSDIDLLGLYDHHQRRKNLVTLAVDRKGLENHVGIDDLGKLVSIKDNGAKDKAKRQVTFTGIAIYEPGFLSYLPSGVSHVTDAWLKVLQAGEKIGTYDVTGQAWTDLGTLDAYSETVARELALRHEDRYINHKVYVPIECDIKGLSVIEAGAKIGMGVSLENCILFPGGSIKGGEKAKSKLFYQGGELPLRTFHKLEKVISEEDILSGGSNRVYSHISLSEDLHGIMLKTPPDDPDFDRQVAYTQFFRQQGIPVPRILYCDPRRHRALFEDLGKTDLFSWFHANKEGPEVGTIYKTVIDTLVRFQNVDPSLCEPLQGWFFDTQTLLWETRYFLERFVKGYLNLSVKKEGNLEEEFQDLAERVNQYPKRVMHRDFQSCNIMILSGEIHFIDYQGARMGPPAYDIVSLVFDPYCELPDALEGELCRYYVAAFSKASGYDASILSDSLIYCGLQRHMQALGAYGFLSRIKGKTWFEQHIARGVRLLKRETDRVDEEYPVLSDLVDSIAKLVKA